MVRPEVALFVFFAAVLVAAALFWPRRGIVARVLALRRYTERVRIEDALKHLYNCEHAGRACGVESLAGALAVPRYVAVRLFARMEARGLGAWVGEDLRLTAEGRAYALHVLRSHRLWERYLAERTGLHPTDWHEQAEIREHTMSPEEVSALSARLGHPRYDPHGDPIPGADGAMPPAEGVPLTGLAPGELAVIVHLEDEPREVYDRLVRAGLGPRMRVEVLPSREGAVRIRAGGREHELEPMVARSVAVERLPAGSAGEAGVETLAVLAPGEAARVVRLSAACQGPQRRRLLDLGVVPGTRIRAMLRSAAGDPVAYEIRGALIALRREQAEWIQVRREAAGGA
ncbi:MAG TPA: iron dependent repressor, metal binding and dimerization domain protein [Longimicrobiales bacterium]